MKLAIVKYNAGNIQSVIYALKRLGVGPLLTDNPEELQSADKVIFPGVGEASSAMNYLRARGLDQLLPSLKQPFFGICIGQQLMCSHSEEGDVDCLGIFPEKVKKFPKTPGFKVPHMGWNLFKDEVGHPLFKGIDAGHAYVYYVHSFACTIGEHTMATSDYIHPFSAGMQKDNFYAVQFHPEKSGDVGKQVLENFLAL